MPKRNLMTPTFSYPKIIIDDIEGTSGVFTGRNVHYGYRASNKENEGMGSISGSRNASIQNAARVLDKDVWDGMRTGSENKNQAQGGDTLQRGTLEQSQEFQPQKDGNEA